MFGNCECLTNSLCHCPSRYCVQTGVVVCAHAATSLLGYGGTAARCLVLGEMRQQPSSCPCERTLDEPGKADSGHALL